MTARSTAIRNGNPIGGFGIVRTGVIGLAKALTLGLSSVAAAPLGLKGHHEDAPEDTAAGRWVLLTVSMALVLLGGAFAGLTIALMGQDSIYLQVLAGDPYEPQSKNAKRVYDLLKKGKHWVLVTLLLGNVVVNETLPVVLDRGLGGGVAAVVGSTVLIVIFGEVVPQSICVRYGLQIGGIMSKPVLLMMWLMAPVAWPTAKLLDWALGEDHGTVYKKSGLKTLVTLHKSLGDVGERLNQDEVTIISAVLDLKGKPVEQVMTPMDDVFVMSEDTVLDEKTMDRILSEGYSRIPIHAPGKPRDFVGMLLVKMLITYDPEDGCQVRDFPLATLPETRPETSCLDIVNFFQEGKSHMVLVSECPGDDHGALGVVTLEDVIEELIGEEIIDESDVYIDVHKAIRRLTPAPKARPMKKVMEETANRADTSGKLIDLDDAEEPRDRRLNSLSAQTDSAGMSSSPGKKATFLMRRSSAGPDGRLQATTVPVKANLDEIKRQLRHLGPSNRNTNPRDTRSTTVKIKPVIGNAGHSHPHITSPTGLRPASIAGEPIDTAIGDDYDDDAEFGGDETTPLVHSGISGKGGAHAVRQSYGGAGMSDAQSRLSRQSQIEDEEEGEATALSDDKPAEEPQLRMPTLGGGSTRGESSGSKNQSPTRTQPDAGVAVTDVGRQSSQGSIISVVEDGSSTPRHRNIVRSGSISENVVETSSGVRKIIIQATSSDSDDAGSRGSGSGSNLKLIEANGPSAQRPKETSGASPTAEAQQGVAVYRNGTLERIDSGDVSPGTTTTTTTSNTNGTGSSANGNAKKKSSKKKKKKARF